MYLFVKSEEYEEHYKESHPHARCAEDGSEYVLSGVGNLTAEEAREHINNHWPQPTLGEEE